MNTAVSSIITDPNICGGVPIFAGTRIPIYLILEMISAGESSDAIVENYPGLTSQQIADALHYASEILKYGDEWIEISD